MFASRRWSPELRECPREHQLEPLAHVSLAGVRGDCPVARGRRSGRPPRMISLMLMKPTIAPSSRRHTNIGSLPVIPRRARASRSYASSVVGDRSAMRSVVPAAGAHRRQELVAICRRRRPQLNPRRRPAPRCHARPRGTPTATGSPRASASASARPSGCHTQIVTSTMLRTSSSSLTVVRVSRPRPGPSRVMTSTTLNRLGSSARALRRGSGLGPTGERAPAPPRTAGFVSTRSSGTMFAPVPFVSVSSTQTLPNSPFIQG